jgi:group I intron endonuclease
MTSGIYSITSPSGKQYIGSAVNIESRRRVHFHLLNKEKHFNVGLQRAYHKYGLSNLIFKTLLLCDQNDLLMFEQRAIDILCPEYNSCPVAGSQLGRRHTEDAKQRMSIINKNRRATPETREKISLSLIGNKRSLGRKQSDEERRKHSLALVGRPAPKQRIEAAIKRWKGVPKSLSSIEKRQNTRAQRLPIERSRRHGHAVEDCDTCDLCQKSKLLREKRKTTRMFDN